VHNDEVEKSWLRFTLRLANQRRTAMSRLLSTGLPALLIVALGASTGFAEVVIRTPFVTVQLGRPAAVPVRAAPVAVPQAVPVQVPVPIELPPPLVPATPALPPPASFQAARPMTHAEFAAGFQPLPGTYEVLLVHPGSKCAVPVRFTLPPGCPKVRVSKRELDFDYGKHEVQIRFRLCGKVTVDYK
jgi:hypothetical protein